MKQYNNDFIRLMLGGLLCLFVSEVSESSSLPSIVAEQRCTKMT